MFERLFAQNAETLLQGAGVLAADDGFREAVASDDGETVASSALENHGARLGASLAIRWSTEPAPRAASGSTPAPDALDWPARLVDEAFATYAALRATLLRSPRAACGSRRSAASRPHGASAVRSPRSRRQRSGSARAVAVRLDSVAAAGLGLARVGGDGFAVWMDGELRRAIERDELGLDDPPKVTLADGRVAGAKAPVHCANPSPAACRPTDSCRSPSRPARSAASPGGCRSAPSRGPPPGARTGATCTSRSTPRPATRWTSTAAAGGRRAVVARRATRPSLARL